MVLFMSALTGPMLREMIFESCERINEKVDYLNDINVFPVPDGDTGVNIYITIGAVVEELEKEQDNLTIKEAAKAIAKGAFKGAKGNSGVILSQFFMGFAKSIEDCSIITPKHFAEALIEGSKRADKAVMNPREGTILTVIKDTAHAALSKIDEGAGWKDTVEYCYEIAQKSTLDTPNLLQELKDAGVVDAGALGFVYLLQGWIVVIVNSFEGMKVVDIRSDLENLHNTIDKEHMMTTLKFRYCTEASITSVNITEDQIKNQLRQYGDSLIVIRDEKTTKVHIHSNEPNLVIKDFKRHGRLNTAKIDDMKLQTFYSNR